MAMRALLSSAVPALVLLTVSAGLAREIEAPERGAVRAVLVGVDLYRNVPPLHGAVADAEDLSITLRSVGVEDMNLLKDGDASRDNILKTIESVTERTRPGDLVVLGIAGHGSSEPERVKGSKPNGRDEVYVLAGFDTRLPGSRERIFGDEFKALIKGLEAKGADVLFIADTCHAGGMTRDVDPRSDGLVWRQVPTYRIQEDDLTPIATTADALATSFDFKRLTFMAAVDENSKSPEISIPGVEQKRGALSYAMARAFEGAADRDGDGTVTRRELFEYARQTVYQFTNQRQNIFTESPPDSDLDRSVVFAYEGAAAADAAPPQAASGGQAPPPGGGQAATILVAALGDASALDGVGPALTPFKLGSAEQAELVFDPARREAVADGDVIATDVGAQDIPFVVDRMAALAMLKQVAGKSPETVRVTPSDQVHHAGDKAGVAISGIAGRNLVLFDITGDGTVQMLYPIPSDPQGPLQGDFSVDLKVVPPFGTDLLVAVTSAQRMPMLEDFLNQNDRRRAAGSVAGQFEKLLPADARVGFSVLYTSDGAKP